MLLNYASNLTTSSRGYGLPMCLVIVMIIGVVFLHSTAFIVNCELFFDFIARVVVSWAVLLSKEHVKKLTLCRLA